MLLTRNRLLGIPPLVIPQTGELVGTTEVRRSGTAWDFLPRLESEKLSDDRFILVLARGELGILANCIDAILQEMASMGPEGRDSELHSRTDMRARDAEAFRDELRRLDRKTRLRGSG